MGIRYGVLVSSRATDLSQRKAASHYLDLMKQAIEDQRTTSPPDGVEGSYIHDYRHKDLSASTAGLPHSRIPGTLAGSVNSRPAHVGPASQPAELTMQLIYADYGPIGGKYAAEGSPSPRVARRRLIGKE